MTGFTGEPYSRCYPIVEKPRDPINPCIPSPCGPNSDCRVIGESPACSCLPNFIGLVPNCRPECTINSECQPNQACMNQRCVDPCPGSCGFNTKCTIINHTPSCSCEEGYAGDAFVGCTPIPGKYKTFPMAEFTSLIEELVYQKTILFCKM